MRILCGIWLAAALASGQSGKAKKDAVPRQGIKTPGVQIPIASLKAEAELPLAPRFIVFADSVLMPNKQGGLVRLDAKTNKLADPVGGAQNLCGGWATGFTSLWIADCAAHGLARLDEKVAADPKKIPEKAGDKEKPKLAEPVSIATGVGSAIPAIAPTADSIWILSDDKTTLSRVDPDQNKVVSELRLPAGCNSLTSGEAALWVTCPAENRVLRVNPATTLIEKRIEVSTQPAALALGEASIWVLCLKDGKIERIDPKTNKVTKTIETGVTGAATGGLAFGAGSLWVTLPGFPLTRIDPKDERVAQQFWGAGGGAIFFGQGSLWLTNVQEGTLWRVDPRRAMATLAE
jgi:streptogramin lyase